MSFDMIKEPLLLNAIHGNRMNLSNRKKSKQRHIDSAGNHPTVGYAERGAIGRAR